MVERRRVQKSSGDDELNEMVEEMVGAPTKPTPALPGTTITVSWGEETIHPVQYNGFRFGGLVVTAPVQPGESLRDAHDRIYAELDVIAKLQFKEKLVAYIERLKEAGMYAKRDRDR